MTANAHVVGGIDRTAQSLRGLADFYNDLLGHQLAIYHGVSRENGYKLKSGELKGVHESLIYRDRIGRGGLGSGKTVGGVYLVLVASAFRPNNQWMVVRKRKEQLRNTFVADFKELAEKVTDGKPEYLLVNPDGQENDGAIEMFVYSDGKPSQIIFRIEPDGDDDFVKDSFKAYQLGGFLIEEGSQIKKVTFDMLRGRLRRPNVPHAGVLLTNPVYRGHWLNEFTTELEDDLIDGKRPEVMLVQSSMLDNPHLPADYVKQQLKQYEKDPVQYQMLIEGFDGVRIDGRPVFQGHFDTKRHVSDALKFASNLPVYRGWDFGWHHPACVWFQIDKNGNVNILRELLGKEETITHFATRVLDISKREFPGNDVEFVDFGDPAGAQQTDKGDSTIVILSRMGIRVKYRKSVIDSGLDLIRSLLSTDSPTTKGLRPRIMFHPRVQDIIMAIRQGYHYKKNDEMVREKPHKDGYYDHLMDAMRYGLINLLFVPTDKGRKGGADFMQGPDALPLY